jgi:hypothetical protein
MNPGSFYPHDGFETSARSRTQSSIGDVILRNTVQTETSHILHTQSHLATHCLYRVEEGCNALSVIAFPAYCRSHSENRLVDL